MQMAINPVNSTPHAHPSRRVNRAFKSLLRLDEKYEEKIDTTLNKTHKRDIKETEDAYLTALNPEARASLRAFQQIQARFNAAITYA
ncbi:MAG TPA: hypothetical protein ENK65_01165 [Helicobacteraceae bacterium]|nr:hypothetical protein [Helicobacteraceae bacterium]